MSPLANPINPKLKHLWVESSTCVKEGKMRQIPLLSHKFPTCLFIFPFRCMHEIRLHKILLYQATEVVEEEAKKSFIKNFVHCKFLSTLIPFWLFTHSAVFSALRRRDCFHKYWCLLFCYSLLHSLRFIFYFFPAIEKIFLSFFWCQKSRNFFSFSCQSESTQKSFSFRGQDTHVQWARN